MSKRNSTDARTITSNPNFGRRLILSEDQWRQAKEAIDSARSDPHDYGAQETLINFGLWDLDKECVNEDNVNFLYMRNT